MHMAHLNEIRSVLRQQLIMLRQIQMGITSRSSDGKVASNGGHEGNDGPRQALRRIIQGLHIGLGQLHHRYVAQELRGQQHEERDAKNGQAAFEGDFTHDTVPVIFQSSSVLLAMNVPHDDVCSRRKL